MQHFLSTDIISAFNRSHYGSADDPITVVAEHGNVLIVEGPDKNRYAVTSIEIRTDKNHSTPPVILELIPLPPESKSIPKPKTKIKKDQASLF